MIIEICAKCSDMCSISGGDIDYHGYVPYGIGIQQKGDGGDYVHFKLNTQTGKIVDFPTRLTDDAVRTAISNEEEMSKAP